MFEFSKSSHIKRLEQDIENPEDMAVKYSEIIDSQTVLILKLTKQIVKINDQVNENQKYIQELVEQLNQNTKGLTAVVDVLEQKNIIQRAVAGDDLEPTIH